jgi:hypothetical protein
VALGARSLRGAMGTYAAVGALAVLVLALVLWIGGPQAPVAQVTLPAAAGLLGAVLESGQARHALSPGATLALPPGRYRLTLLRSAGPPERRELELAAGPVTLQP